MCEGGAGARALAVGGAALEAALAGVLLGPELALDLPRCPADLHAGARPAAGAEGEEEEREAKEDRWALGKLAADGEDVLGRIQLPQYLVLACVVLAECCRTPGPGLESAPWWAARTALLRQRLLGSPSASLQAQVFSLYSRVVRHTNSGSGGARFPWGRDLAALALLESALAFQHYRRVDDATAMLKQCEEVLGVKVGKTGMLGRRTVHQVDAKAQRVVRAEPRGDAAHGNEEWGEWALDEGVRAPRDWLAKDLDESDVLVAPALEGEGGSAQLKALEQCLVMAWCEHERRAKAKDDLTSWDMAAYVEAVLRDGYSGVCPAVAVACSLYSVRFEAVRGRTRERALARMEGLAEALRLPGTLPDPDQRIAPCGFSIALPSLVHLQQELGEMYLGMGIVGEAMKIFERLELWEPLIVTYRMLGKLHVAQHLIEDRLKEEPDSPKLLCAYGDVVRDEKYYLEAWEKSGRRYGRAQRNLAWNAQQRKDFRAAREHWELALAVNPLHPKAWFDLGYSCMKLGDSQAALQAFTRVTQICPQHREAWNNVAALSMRSNQWSTAFSALSEALRHGKRNWQTWDNYTEAALRTGQFQQALNSMNQILKLTSSSSKAKFDSNAILALVRFLGREKRRDPGGTDASEAPEGAEPADTDFLDMDDLALGEDEDAGVGLDDEGGDLVSDGSIGDEHRIEVGSREWDVLLEALQSTLKAAAAAGIQGYDFWSAYSEFFLLIGDRTCYREALLKRLRALQGGSWHERWETFTRFVEALVDVATAHLDDLAGKDGAHHNLEGIRLLLVGSLRQSTEVEFEEGKASREKLQAILAQVETAQKE